MEKNKEYFSYITKLKNLEESKESYVNFFLEKIDNYLKDKIKVFTKLENNIKLTIQKKEKIEENKKNLIDE